MGANYERRPTSVAVAAARRRSIALSLRDAGRHNNTKVLGWIAIILSALNMIGGATLAATGNYPGLS